MKNPLIFFFLLLFIFITPIFSSCPNVCDLAFASYYLSNESSLGFPLNLTYIATTLFNIQDPKSILPYNPQVTSQDVIITGTRIKVPFQCNCVNDSFLGHTFNYTATDADTYGLIASMRYANLTSEGAVVGENGYPENNIPLGAVVGVTVKCSCGDLGVSREYGLFETYPVREGESLDSIAKAVGFGDVGLLRNFNPGANFSAGEIVFLPAKDQNGSYHPLRQYRMR